MPNAAQRGVFGAGRVPNGEVFLPDGERSLWQVAIGNAGEDQLANKAYEEAQRVLVPTASDAALIQRAKKQAQRVIAGMFEYLGWTLLLRNFR